MARRARIGMSSATPSFAAPAYVRIKVFEAIVGYTEEAVHTKIKRGVWLAGKEYIRAPDGNILISLEGFYRWAEGQRQAA